MANADNLALSIVDKEVCETVNDLLHKYMLREARSTILIENREGNEENETKNVE